MLSARSEYAVRLILELSLAAANGTGAITAAELATRTGVHSAYLPDVLRTLRTAGIARSTRGPSGGYTLTRHPREITVAEVLGSCEGQVRLVSSSIQAPHDPENCSSCGHCALGRFWDRTTAGLLAELQSTSFADLLNVDSRSDRKGPKQKRRPVLP